MSKTLAQALGIYAQAQATSSLRKRAQLVAEALTDLEGEENIQKIAEQEDEFLRAKYSISSLGTKLSQLGYNKLINGITPKEGVNAQKIGKRDAEGNIKSYQLKHYFFKYCGLGKKAFYPNDETIPDEWAIRNDTTRIIDRSEIDPDTEEGEKWAINPEQYLAVTKKLITSNELFEICAGLIAASGRRPNEIFRGKFELIENEPYAVLFKSGFAKKRGEKIEPYKISTLVSAHYWLEQLRYFQRSQEVKAILAEVRKESKVISTQNQALDSRTNQRFNRLIRQEFQEVLAPRPTNKGKTDQTSATDLRSAYLCLAVERDYPGSLTRKIVAAGKLTGHLALKEGKSLTDRELSKLGYTIGYAAYYVAEGQKVPLMEIPVEVKGQYHNVKVNTCEYEQIKSWCQQWEMTQREVLAEIVKLAQSKLEEQLEEKSGNEDMVQTVDNSELAQLKADFEEYKQATNLKLDQLLEAVQNQSPVTEPVTVQGYQVAAPKPKKATPMRDWESVSKEELFGWSEEFPQPARGKGAKEARITRAIKGIFEWNNQFPHDQCQEKKIVINNQLLRTLTGANPQAIKVILDQYQPAILDNAHKHGLVTEEGELDIYHNKRAKPEPFTNPELLRPFIA